MHLVKAFTTPMQNLWYFKKEIPFSSLAIDRLKSADDAFRKQLEDKVQAFQEQITQMEQDKQAEVDQANLRVCPAWHVWCWLGCKIPN